MTRPQIPTTLEEARSQAKLLRAQAACAKAICEKNLYESLWGPIWDGFGGSDLWDRLRPQSQDDDGEIWVPPNVPSDRRHGSNWPVWRTQVELDEFRQRSRILVQTNSFAQGLLKNWTNNVIGKGFSYKTKAKGEEPKGDADPAISQAWADRETTAKQVQAFVDDFLRCNRWNANQIDPRENMVVAQSREREIFRRENGGDGECFCRLFFQDNGRTLVRFLEPEQVRDGNGGTAQDGWSYGIRHRMDPFEDVETPEEYAVFWPDPSAKGGEGDNAKDKGSWEIVPAKEIVHFKGIDTPSTVKRGISIFQFDMLGALARASKLQRYASTSATVRAATAEIWQSSTATQAQAQNLADAVAEFQRTDSRNGQSLNVEKLRPGSIRRVGGGMELATPAADQTQSYLSGVAGDLRQANAAVCAPEFWTGDASNGNYSSLESAAAPAVRAGQTDQEYYKLGFGLVVWKAILWAVECGKLPSNTLDVVDLDVEAPAVLHRNELDKANEDQIGVTVGWKDRQTCAAERGLDWDTVQANNQEYQESQAGGMGGGGLELPPEQQPGSGGGLDLGGGLGGGLTESLLESLEAELLEAGFTGTIKDALGRTLHYQNGKRVKTTGAPTADPVQRAKAAEIAAKLAQRHEELHPSEPAPAPVPKKTRKKATAKSNGGFSSVEDALNATKALFNDAKKESLDFNELRSHEAKLAKLPIEAVKKIASALGISGKFKSRADAIKQIHLKIAGMHNTMQRVRVGSGFDARTEQKQTPKKPAPKRASHLPERKSVPVPLPVEKKPYPNPDSNDRHNAMNSGAATHELDPKKLIATQANVFSDSLDRIKGDLRKDKPIVVIRHGGKDYIEEGHHRVVKALQTGQKVPAVVMTISEDGKLHPVKS